MSEESLLTPTELARLASLRLDRPNRATGAIVGRHRSIRRGSSIEFADHKEYAPGDEIRTLDWKAYAKHDKYYVKRFEDETNLTSLVVIDASASMGYASESVTKLRYASKLAAAIAFVLLKYQDSVGLIAIRDQVIRYVPPRARSSHFRDLERVLLSLEPAESTSLQAALKHIVESGRLRKCVYVISDFFDELQHFAPLLSQVCRRHEVSLIQVLDRFEMDLPFEELTHFSAMETSQRILAEPKLIRSRYKRELQRFQSELRQLALHNGANFTLAATDEPVDATLLRSFQTRLGERSRRHAV